MLYYVCGGFVSCRRVADRLTVSVRSCKWVRYCLECGTGEVSVHTGLELALEGGAEIRTN